MLMYLRNRNSAASEKVGRRRQTERLIKSTPPRACASWNLGKQKGALKLRENKMHSQYENALKASGREKGPTSPTAITIMAVYNQHNAQGGVRRMGGGGWREGRVTRQQPEWPSDIYRLSL